MKFSTAHLIPFLSFPAVAFAHAKNPHHHRQVAAAASASTAFAATSSSSGSSTSAVSTSAVSTSSVSTSSVIGSSAGSSVLASGTNLSSLFPTPTGPTPSFSLQSENPTAVPVSSIVVNAPPLPTSIMPNPLPAGTKPSNIPNAPGLPDLSSLSPANYPALDTPPPTDSDEVQQWIAEVAQSGVKIPDIPPTVAGGCAANPAVAANSSVCWWTCGGCTRSTDITTCPQQRQWGLTYDDGPAVYTPNLLSYLEQVKLLATLFVVGSRCISFPGLLQQEYITGHQIAVHTWSHPYLTTLTNEEIIAELGWTKKVIRDVLGVTPIIMRPPYGDIDDRVRAICTAMNLVPVMWSRFNTTTTFDTGDYDIHGGLTNVQQVLYNWESIMNDVPEMDTGFIVLEHDLFQQSVEVATGYIIPDALARQPALNITPVISCQNRPMGDAYLETNDNKSNPLPLSLNSSGSNSGNGSGKKNGAVAGVVARMNVPVVIAGATMIFGALAFTF